MSKIYIFLLYYLDVMDKFSFYADGGFVWVKVCLFRERNSVYAI